MENIIDFLSAKEVLDKKTRINLYLPEAIVKIIDSLAEDKSRGELVSKLVIKEARKKKKLPYGLFSPLEIPAKEIDGIVSSWNSQVNELT